MVNVSIQNFEIYIFEQDLSTILRCYFLYSILKILLHRFFFFFYRMKYNFLVK